MLSNQQIQNNWTQIKSQVLSKWNKLSEAEVEDTHGSAQSLESLVNSKYGNVANFDQAYDKICKNFSSPVTAKNDIENRSATAPSAEAGMRDTTTEAHHDDTFSSGSPEKRANANFAKVEKDIDADPEFTQLNNNESSNQFTAPDEFTPFQDPSPSREDITLGRKTSSATKISTAQAAPISSEASNDAKKKI